MNGLSQDDIIRMAREVADIQTDSRGRAEFIFDSYGIEAFANLVAAAEREACAKVCESAGPGAGPIYCAFAIRARAKHAA